MTSNTKEYMRNYMQFYRWYDKTYKGGMYTLQQKEYMSYYYAEHRHRIINQVRQNRLRRKGILGSKDTEMIANTKSDNDLIKLLTEIKHTLRL